MTDIIKHWIVKKLGLPVSFNRGGDRFRQELSNGHLFGEILRKYHLISDDMLMNLTDSICPHHREKNMHILHQWLQSKSFEIELHELADISQSKPGAALSFLYRMYLWLEGPGSRPGLQPRQKEEEIAIPSVESIEGQKNRISYVTNKYTKQNVIEKEFKDYLKYGEEPDDLKQMNSLDVNDVSKTGLKTDKSENAIPVDGVNSFSALRSEDFIKRLEDALVCRKEVFKDTVPKLVVSRASLMSLKNEVEEDGRSKRASFAESARKSIEDGQEAKKEKSEPSNSVDGEFEPYIEVDGKGLEALECGQLPTSYLRNYPFGNTSEKFQAGNLYFHSKAMMILNDQRMSAQKDFQDISAKKCGNLPFVGKYEESIKYQKEKKFKRYMMSMENALKDMKIFDEKLKEEPAGSNNGTCEDFSLKIYPNGRGDWTEASSKITELKRRRRKDKQCFQKRCNIRKMMAASLVKSYACEMHEELDNIIHSKLVQQSRQESKLADYCASSHLEKRAFLDHIKFEQEQLLNMGMIQVAKEVIHAEQLAEIKKKVDKITEDNNNHIANEVLATKQKAQFIMDIKFCEEIFTVIVKTAIEYSEYRSTYGCDPPKGLVAEWMDALYMCGCVTSVKLQNKKASKHSKKLSVDHDKHHVERCKKKRKEEKEAKAAKKLQAKHSKSSNKSNISIKSNYSGNRDMQLSSPVNEDIMEEEREEIHTFMEEKLGKRKHSGKKPKRKDSNIQKMTSNDSVSNKANSSDIKVVKSKTIHKKSADKDNKISRSKIADKTKLDGNDDDPNVVKDPVKKHRKESNVKKIRSKTAKEKRKQSLKKKGSKTGTEQIKTGSKGVLDDEEEEEETPAVPDVGIKKKTDKEKTTAKDTNKASKKIAKGKSKIQAGENEISETPSKTGRTGNTIIKNEENTSLEDTKGNEDAQKKSKKPPKTKKAKKKGE